MTSQASESRRHLVEIFLISFAALILEISYTRLISFKLFYYYTYLIIGIALLGIGAGGVIIATFPRLREVETLKLLSVTSLLGSLSVGLGYFVISLTPLNAIELTTGLGELPKLLVVSSALFATFFAVGLMIATLFSRDPESIDRLYFADLLGAGLACALIVPLLTFLSPPVCIFLAGTTLALTAALIAYRRFPRLFYASVAAALLLALPIPFPRLLPEPVPDEMKTMHALRNSESVLFSKWSPVFRVDVSPSKSGSDDRLLLHHDGLWGSEMHRFNGDVSSLSRFDTNVRLYPFRTLVTPPKRILIIGAAGGHEILASLYFDADFIRAVELNPVTVSLLTTVFPDYSGNIATNPKVDLVNDEGRGYLARDDSKYDLIFFVAPDSYSAMNAATAGAFVLSESYLYTSEMILESLDHLSENGIICMQFGEIAYDSKPNRTARYVGTARKAFAELGIPDFEKHVLVSTTPSFFQVSTVLLKRTPFDREDVGRFLNVTNIVKGSVARHAWGKDLDNGAVNQVITLDDEALDTWYDRNHDNVRPITDDAPFFWHFARFKNVVAEMDRDLGELNVEDSIGERLLLVMLGVSAFFAAIFLLLPFVTIREVWSGLPAKGRSALYFGSLGLGFMFYEITLIQKFTLFLGYPTYSLTVTLMSVLVFAGIGSWATQFYAHRQKQALVLLAGCILLLTLFYQFALDGVMGALLGASLAVRVPVTIALMAPLGLCLGAFMPLGLSTVSKLTRHPAEYVAWGWALNGFFSVIGSVLTTVLSMTFGFRVVLFLGLGIYVFAVAILRSMPDPVETE